MPGPESLCVARLERNVMSTKESQDTFPAATATTAADKLNRSMSAWNNFTLGFAVVSPVVGLYAIIGVQTVVTGGAAGLPCWPSVWCSSCWWQPSMLRCPRSFRLLAELTSGHGSDPQGHQAGGSKDLSRVAGEISTISEPNHCTIARSTQRR